MRPPTFQEPENKPDYRAQTAKELDKVQSKAILLNDMLNNAKEGEKFVRDDAYDVSIPALATVEITLLFARMLTSNRDPFHSKFARSSRACSRGCRNGSRMLRRRRARI